MNMSTKDWLMLILLSVIWGGSYFFVEIALTGFPVLVIVLLRISIAAAALWIFIAATQTPVPREPRTWIAFAVMGVLNNIIPFSLLTWGQVEITSSLAAILTATAPMFAIVVAAVWLHDEQVTRTKVFAIALGFAGVVLMIGPDALSEIGAAVYAQLAVLTAAFFYSLSGAFGRRFHAWGVQPVVTAAGQVTMSSILLGIAVFATHDSSALAGADVTAWSAVVALALVCTAIAYILYFRILASAGTTNLMLVTFLIPVSAMLLGVFILGEHVRPIEYAGMSLIGLGLLIIDGRLLKRFSRRASGI